MKILRVTVFCFMLCFALYAVFSLQCLDTSLFFLLFRGVICILLGISHHKLVGFIERDYPV